MNNFSPLELRKKLYNDITPSLRWNGVDNLKKHKQKCRKQRTGTGTAH